MELSLRLLHLPVDGSPVTQELGQSGPGPVSRKITQDPVTDSDVRSEGASGDRRTSASGLWDRDRQKRRHRSARILIVGEESAAEAVRDHLLERGHTVDLAFSADDALMAIRQVRRDVVLLDISTPELDGVEALRRIRAVDATLPVIVVAGNEDASIGREAVKLGACGSVVKPMDFADLDRAIAAALTSRGARPAGHPDADTSLCHAPSRGLRAKRLDSSSAGLAQPLHKLVEGGPQ